MKSKMFAVAMAAALISMAMTSSAASDRQASPSSAVSTEKCAGSSSAQAVPSRRKPSSRLVRKAEKGDADAQCRLGEFWYGQKEQGKGSSDDILMATYWYQKAADQGNEEAKFMLGKIYFYFGDRRMPDEKKALYWLDRAAAQGDPDAVAGLADYRKRGRGGLTRQAD